MSRTNGGNWISILESTQSNYTRHMSGISTYLSDYFNLNLGRKAGKRDMALFVFYLGARLRHTKLLRASFSFLQFHWQRPPSLRYGGQAQLRSGLPPPSSSPSSGHFGEQEGTCSAAQALWRTNRRTGVTTGLKTTHEASMLILVSLCAEIWDERTLAKSNKIRFISPVRSILADSEVSIWNGAFTYPSARVTI